MCGFVCVCARARVCVRVRACLCVCARVCVRALVCACVCVCVCARACVCVSGRYRAKRNCSKLGNIPLRGLRRTTKTVSLVNWRLVRHFSKYSVTLPFETDRRSKRIFFKNLLKNYNLVLF